MNKGLKLLAILAHPDDESLGFGGTLAKYADEGVETYLITATRGERGRFGDASESPGLEVVGKTRTEEILAAAKVLEIKEVHFLNYIDGDLDKAPPKEASDKIANLIRKIKPQVVVTFDPYGGYGHPDHIAISQLAMSGVLSAASIVGLENVDPWIVSKLYYRTWPPEVMASYEAAFKQMVFNVDGTKRKATPWPNWSITTKIDTLKYWKQVWQAVNCHQTQISIYNKLRDLSPENHQNLWGKQSYYRVFSMVNGGRAIETDIFEGLR